MDYFNRLLGDVRFAPFVLIGALSIVVAVIALILFLLRHFFNFPPLRRTPRRITTAPLYPIIRMRIFGIVVPLLCLWYFLHAFSACIRGMQNGSLGAGLDGMWMMIKGVVVAIGGGISLISSSIMRETAEKNFKEHQEWEEENAAKQARISRNIAANELYQAELAARPPIIPYSIKLADEEAARTAELKALNEELERLKSFTPFLSEEDATQEAGHSREHIPLRTSHSDASDIIL